MFKLAKKAFRSIARSAVEWVFARDKDRRGGLEPRDDVPSAKDRLAEKAAIEKSLKETVTLPAGPSRGLRPVETGRDSEGPAPIERRGAARDERSFEQRRRGGPVTGEAPSKTHGPRHTGGGHTRGRSSTEEEEEAVFPDLPVVDYDELSVPEIEDRVGQLDDGEIRQLLDYEIANKHRKSVIDALSRRLAA